MSEREDYGLSQTIRIWHVNGTEVSTSAKPEGVAWELRPGPHSMGPTVEPHKPVREALDELLDLAIVLEKARRLVVLDHEAITERRHDGPGTVGTAKDEAEEIRREVT